MADRTVKVVLKADIGSYVRDVERATVATEALREEAERFADRYTATLRVNTVGAVRDMKSAEQSMDRSSTNMGKSLDGAARKLQDRMRGIRDEISSLEKGDPVGDMLAGDEARIRGEIDKIKSHLNSLSGQKITIPIAAEITQGQIEIAQLEDELRRLDRSKYEPEVRLKMDRLRSDMAEARRAFAELQNKRLELDPGAFASKIKAQVEAAGKSLPQLPIRADATAVEREIVKIKAELAALGNKRIGVDMDSKTFMAEATALQARLQQIARTSTSVRFQTDAGKAARELDGLGSAAGRAGRSLDGTKKSSEGASKGFFQLARNASDSSRSMLTLAIPPALLAAAPAVASLGSSLMDVSGALALIPAAGFAAGAGLATVVIGMRDWKKTVQDLLKGDMKKANAEIAKLAPSARETALELVAMASAYDKAAKAVQQELFKGTKGDLQLLGKVYLPIVHDQLAGIASQLNVAAHAFTAFATSARTTKDTKDGLDALKRAAAPLAGVIVNLSAIMRDLGVVGADVLPGMSRNFETTTKRWADFIDQARRSGDIARWIHAGVEEIDQLGRVTRNTGSILKSIFDGAKMSGTDFLGTLERLTGEAARFLESAQGKSELLSFFTELRRVGADLAPGLRAVGDVINHMLSNAARTDTLDAAAKALSNLAVSAAPVVKVLGDLTNMVLTPFLRLISGISPVLGPAIAGILAFRTAASAVSTVQGKLVGSVNAAGVATEGLAGRFNRAAQAASGNEMATSRVSTALGKVSGALPFIGVALVGVGLAYDALRSHADDAASAVLNGSESMTAGFQETYESLVRQRSALEPGIGLTMIFGSAQEKAGVAIDTANRAIYSQNMAISDQIAKMPPLQAAQAQVTLAQDRLNQAVGAGGIASQGAILAQQGLAYANQQLQIQQIATTQGVDLNTAAMIRNRDMMLAASNADIAWHQSVDGASAAVAANGRTLDLNTQQGRANQQALNDLSQAALADVDAKRKQEGETIAVTDLGRKHQDQLFRTAIQMGMSRDEAGRYVAQLGLVPPSQETRFFTPGLVDAINGVSELSRLLNSVTTANQSREALRGAVTGAKDRLAQIQGRAAGGPITGPGSGTSDDVLMWGSNGEWVIKHSTVQDQGHGRMALLNSGQGEIVPKGMLPGYASGGLISLNRTGAQPRRDVVLDFTGAAEAARQWKNEWFPPIPVGGGGGSAVPPGPILAVLQQTAAQFGWGGGALFADLLQLVQHESGFNPNAQNPTSTAYGLFQFLNSTWGGTGIGRTSNPSLQALAGMRYIASAYGNPSNAWHKWLSRSPHWYHDGGRIPGTGDVSVAAQGGERVLSRGQNVAFERLVSVLDKPQPMPAALRGRTRGGDGSSVVNNIHNENHFTEAVDLDLFNSRQDFAVRSLTF